VQAGQPTSVSSAPGEGGTESRPQRERTETASELRTAGARDQCGTRLCQPAVRQAGTVSDVARPDTPPPGRLKSGPLPLSACVPWSEAINAALYGHGGFFHRPEGPAGHFRTSVHVSQLFASSVLSLLEAVDAAIGRPERIDLVDMGAGRGELLVDVLGLVHGRSLEPRLHLHAVELAHRPADLPASIAWSTELPERITGLVIANEWLDNVPIDVASASPEGPVRVLVDPADGSEVPGGPIGLQDARWLAQWWPLGPTGRSPGDRAEIGSARDDAWSTVVEALDRGVAVAVDYGHVRGERESGQFAAGTLSGYRGGQLVAAIPDGTCDLTAHVAIDACAAAGQIAGAQGTRVIRQREALQALGLSAVLPPVEQARSEPAAYIAALRHANEAAELLDADGLGSFWWLVQSVGIDIPALLAR
jgi:SAM-dependent MidA family methyltransferase